MIKYIYVKNDKGRSILDATIDYVVNILQTNLMKMREKEINLFLFYYSVLLLIFFIASLCVSDWIIFMQVNKIRSR